MRKILWATDLSSQSGAALAATARLCYDRDAEVIVLHAAVDVAAVGAPQRQALDDLCRALQQMDVRCSPQIATGDPVLVTLELASAHDADAIVVLRHGDADLRDPRRLGSHTLGLLRRADRAVLVVHGASRPDAAAPLRPEPWHRILLPTDLSAHGDRGVATGARLAEASGAELVLLSVIVDGRCPLDVGPDHARFAAMPADLQPWARSCAERLTAQLAQLPVGLGRARVVAAEDAAAAIVAAAIEEGAGLIAIPATGQGPIGARLLGSTSEAVVRLSPLPVLVLRPKR